MSEPETEDTKHQLTTQTTTIYLTQLSLKAFKKKRYLFIMKATVLSINFLLLTYSTRLSSFVLHHDRRSQQQYKNTIIPRLSATFCEGNYVNHPSTNKRYHDIKQRKPTSSLLLLSMSENSDSESDKADVVSNPMDISMVSDELWDEMEEIKPSELSILKELLGINIFTFILAGLIIIMLSLNAILGPGWLGQQIFGLENTGTFTETSNSLPAVMDLDGADNLL